MINASELDKKLELLEKSLEIILNDKDEIFIENMKKQGKDVSKFVLWEWPQGVGVYGLFKQYKKTGNKKYLDTLVKWYDERLKDGLPEKNVNTVAPMLTMCFVYDETGNKKYLSFIEEWAIWIFEKMPRTNEGGLQHITSDSLNNGQLWDDTLFMTVLFLAKAGKILNKKEFIYEAEFQFLLHVKYLVDKKTGLWFHGWSFDGNHNFANALWARGNSWLTIGIPEFLEIVDVSPSVKKFLIETLKSQIKSLAKFQDKSGLWHTLIDDNSSYLESSATAGFTFGILKSIRLGFISENYKKNGLLGLKSILNNIATDGELLNVSYGTPMGKDLEFYKKIPLQRMAYGQAMAILALIEGK